MFTPAGNDTSAALSGNVSNAGITAEKDSGAFHAGSFAVCAPVKGNAIAQEEIPDETFACGMLGSGIGIEPDEGVVVSPFDGVISSVVDTKHAVGISSSNGIELLIHVGMDTVKMNGEEFRLFVKEGEQVTAGQKLIEFDIAKIKKAGYSPVTAVIVVNSDDYAVVAAHTGNCGFDKQILTLEK